MTPEGVISELGGLYGAFAGVITAVAMWDLGKKLAHSVTTKVKQDRRRDADQDEDAESLNTEARSLVDKLLCRKKDKAQAERDGQTMMDITKMTSYVEIYKLF